MVGLNVRAYNNVGPRDGSDCPTEMWAHIGMITISWEKTISYMFLGQGCRY